MNNITTAHVPLPDLTFTDETPVSAAFGDVYFSRAGGVAETTHVFLTGNGLPERWVGRKRFVVAELGFGTGLNFLVTMQRFLQTADAGAVLHYHAVEKYPFPLAQLRGVLALQPALATEAELLLAAYPLRLPGAHRIHLPRVVLDLWFGEVGDWLAELTSPPSLRVDAWYLDGFSPAKNPDMWHADVLARMGALSAPGATCATFTVAGHVRRGLQAAGFDIEKCKGFGHKREMVRGVVPPSPEMPKSISTSPKREVSTLVIGAGIAGATLARALAERGHCVTVIARAGVGDGASGNAAGVLFPPLHKTWDVASAFYFSAYGLMLRQLARWRGQGLVFAGAMPGMLRLPRHAAEETQLRALHETLGIDGDIVRWVDRDAASAIAGVELGKGAAYYPLGSWVSPSDLCHALVQHPLIVLRSGHGVKTCARRGDAWVVTLEHGEEIAAPVLCMAAAHETATLLPEYELRLSAVGGQISEIAAGDAAPKLRSILCHKGYVIPGADRYIIGATYHREAMLEVTEARHAENMVEAVALLPHLAGARIMGGRSSLRATTPDRLPYIGALADGLYVSVGHGSRGLLSAPMAAEMIASMVDGEALPLSPALAHATRAPRFTKV